MSKEIEEVDIDELKLYPGNYREGDIGAIIQSIEANGWYGVVIAHRKTKRILAGNHRTQAAQAVGMTSVPVFWIDGDEEQARRILIADNRTSDLATNDKQTLADMLRELTETNRGLAGTGYDTDDLQALLEAAYTPENTPVADPKPTAPAAAQKRWKTKTGQVWTAGKQTLIIGDATSYDTWQHVPKNTDMVFTDPPYGIAYQGGTGLTIENDDVDAHALEQLLGDSLHHALDHSRKGAPWYVCAPGGTNEQIFARVLQAMGIHRQTIIWAKDLFVLSRSDYHGQHEPILYGWTPGKRHTYVAGRDQSTVWKTTLADWQKREVTKINKGLLEQLLEAQGDTTVWEHDRPKRSPEHPTMKPVELVARAIRNSTLPGKTIIDPFVGSGSTLLAAEQTDRHGIGIELDPAYAATALDRLTALDLEPEQVQ